KVARRRVPCSLTPPLLAPLAPLAVFPSGGTARGARGARIRDFFGQSQGTVVSGCQSLGHYTPFLDDAEGALAAAVSSFQKASGILSAPPSSGARCGRLVRPRPPGS